MRVTKTIKEYITEKVNDIYASKLANLPALRKDFDDADEQCYNALKTLREGWEQEARAVCAKYGFEPNPGWKGNGYDSIVVLRQCYGDNVRKSLREKEVALNTEIQKAVQDIVVELELGGDRAKLDAMLAALMERVS